MARHNGKLMVDSVPGVGTTFTALLPTAIEASPGTETLEPLEGIPARILLIDDNERVLKAIEAMLRSEGHTVTSCLGGKRGLTALRQAGFDLVMTDLGMPGINGREVAAQSKNIAPERPVILLTGWAAELGKEQANELGVEGIIQKPCRLTALRQSINQVLNRADVVTGSTGNLAILIVDDNRSFGDALRQRLGIDGHTVTLARSASEALKLCETRRFDLLLSDLRLPDMAGTEVGARIKETGQCPFVAVMTGDIMAVDAVSKQEWCDAIILKPWKEAELDHVLERALRTRQSRRLGRGQISNPGVGHVA